MGKQLFIAEKPSVAQEFARALKENMQRRDGYLESENYVVTWCVGHLVTMSYPEAYDEKYRRWSLETLPFLPQEFKYQVIDGVKKQFGIVSGLLKRKDVDVIYVCTDSGREGEYIYRLVAQEAHLKDKEQKRVWIDSQTEEEILRGIREAKDLSAYDNLGNAAYLRAKEDYLMGINFSRLLTLRYGRAVSGYLRREKPAVLSVGRVMTCVLGMVVRREREIRDFVKTPFYRVFLIVDGGAPIEAEWRAVPGSAYEGSPKLYRDNGFLKREDAEAFVESLKVPEPVTAVLDKVEKKKEKKNAPLLFNLAELQNECSRLFKLSPDQTLAVVQELYEKKLVTYPRTDARVLSTAVSKEIARNISGLKAIPGVRAFAEEILDNGLFKGLSRTRYVNDKQITDHYAIIPTGQGIGALKGLAPQKVKVYERIVRRFLAIFFPPAVYEKVSLEFLRNGERFFAGSRVLIDPGYLKVYGVKPGTARSGADDDAEDGAAGAQIDLGALKKGQAYPVSDIQIREGETTPPKRYTSGSMILAMENAGQLIEDEELRAQIKGSGIGTSATRAEILKKLVNIKYLNLSAKTQVITPTQFGEMVYDVVDGSIRQLLNPELTASWEKGLTYVAEGTISPQEYMDKLEDFVRRRTAQVMAADRSRSFRAQFDRSAPYYARGRRGGTRTAGKAAEAESAQEPAGEAAE
ncbi:MAG: type IA DNA topoisomerase [Lachnospiraceae bacterium]|nr:type IA DNA topoisomerase [Lachnospiraceae bacterium]